MKKKRVKKINWFLKILKTTGISMAGVVGFTGASVGVYALCGGFKDKVVSLQGMNFEQSAYVLTGTNDGGKIVVGVKSAEDGSVESVKLIPTNEDATKLDVTLSGGQNIVKFSDNQKVGFNLNFEIVQTKSSDPNNQNALVSHNKGGEFTLEAIQKEDQHRTTTQIFIDTKVQSFGLVAKSGGEEIDQSKIYKGSTFTMSVENIFPSNALNVPTKNLDTFKSVYGENYFNKSILFFSQNEDIAEVDRTTGAVSVKSDGTFTIDCYLASTYANNAKFPAYSLGQEYINELTKYTVKKSITFTSKQVEVSGISATSEIGTSLKVFETYKYIVDSTLTESDSINLDFSLSVPENSDYSADLLKHKREDIQLFAGYKSGGNYYLSADQTFGTNENILISNYFTITKNINPLSWRIRAEDFTETKDLYLVARISNQKLTKESLQNYLGQTAGVDATGGKLVSNNRDENGNYEYFAFIKVHTEIDPAEDFSFDESRIMVSYVADGLNPRYDDNIVLYNQQMLDITSLISNKNSGATYNFIRYFAINNEDNGLQILDVNDDAENLEDQNEIRRYKKVFDSETGETTFEEDMINGTYIKAFNNGSVQIKAIIYKYKYKVNNDGTYALDDNNQKIYEFIESHRESNSELRLTVSQNLNLSNFEIMIDGEKATQSDDGAYEINKGENVILSFNADNVEGLKQAYSDGYFKIESSNEDIVAISGYNFEDNNCTITFAGAGAGECVISISLNGKTQSYKLRVQTNPVTGIEISSEDNAIIDDEITFVVGEKKDTINNAVNLEYFLKSAIGNEPISANNCAVLNISVTGGTTNTQLHLGIEDNANIVEITDKESSKIQNVVEILTSNLNGTADATGKVDRQITIIPHKLCKNLSFYIYAVEDGGAVVSSRKIKITIKTPDDFEIVENRNTNNQVLINGEIYERVIGGENFAMKGDYDANNVASFLSFKNLSQNLFSVECFSLNSNGDKLYNGTQFINVKQEANCQVKITSTFFNENEERIYNFRIIPKYFVSTTQYNVTTETEIEESKLKSCAMLCTHNYDTSKPSGAYLGDITKQNDNSSGLIYKFYEYNNADVQITNYSIPTNNFEGSDEKIICRIEKTGESYEGYITVNIPSNLKLNDSTDLIGNGEEVYLIDSDTNKSIFKVYSKLADGSYSVLNDSKITNVQLEKQTIEKLQSYGISLYIDSTNNKGSAELDENGCVKKVNSSYLSIKKISVPQNINVFSLDNLKAIVDATLGDGSKATKNGHLFSLNFKLTDLQIKPEISVVYLTEDEVSNDKKLLKDNETKAKIIEMYISSATTNSENFDLRDILQDIVTKKDASEYLDKTKNDYFDVSLSVGINNTGTITFKLNNVSKVVDLIVITNSLAVINDEVSKVTSKAYNISDLIKLNSCFGEATDESYSNVLKTVTIVGVYNYVTKVQLESDEYSLQANNQVLIIKQQPTNAEDISCTIRFNILGRLVDVDYVNEFKGFEIKLEDFNTLYSNLVYNIFDDDTLKTLSDNDLAYSVTLVDKDENNLDGIISWNISNPNQISVLGVSNSITNAKLKVSIHSENFEGSDIYKTINIEKLNVSLNSSKTTTLKNSFAIDFKDYLVVEYINEPNLKIKIDNEELGSGLYSDLDLGYTPTKSSDAEIKLEVYVIDNSQSKLVKTFTFSVKDYKISVVTSPNTYYNGQEISRDDLLSFVQITDSSNNVVTRFNSEIEFYNSTDTAFAKQLCEVGGSGTITLDSAKTFIAKFGGKVTSEFTISPATVKIVVASDSTDDVINVYPDTKLSSYAKVMVNGVENTTLALSFVPVIETSTTDTSGTSTITSSVDTTNWSLNGDYYVYSDSTIKINRYTGEIYVYKNFTSLTNETTFAFKILVENSSAEKLFKINVRKISTTKIKDTLELYAGDYSISLTDNGEFAVSGSTDSLVCLDYEIYSFEDLQNTGYIRVNESDTGVWKLLANNVTHISIEKDSNNYFTKLLLTSKLTELNLVVRGYLNVNAVKNKENDNQAIGYSLVSLRENYVEFTIKVNTINVDFGDDKIEFNNQDYYVLEPQTTISGNIITGYYYLLDPTIKPSNSSGIDSLTFMLGENKNFIGRVSTTGSTLTASEILKYVTENSTKEIVTPTKNKITIPTISGKEFEVTNPLTEYVFITINYTIGNYKNSVNLVLKPSYHIGFNYSTAEIGGLDATVYAPSIYSLSSAGELFYFDFGSSVKSKVLYEINTNFEFAELVNIDTYASANYGGNLSNHTISYLADKDGDSIKFEKNNKTSTSGNYWIKVTLTIVSDSDTKESFYYYSVSVTDVMVKTYNESGISSDDISKKTENSKENSLICSSSEIDLLDYIYINNVSIKDSTNATFKKDITFAVVEENDNLGYTVSKDGQLKILSKLNSGEVTEISFYLYGTEYIFNIKGEDMSVTFVEDSTSGEVVSSKEFQAGTYYLSLIKDETSKKYYAVISDATCSGTTFKGTIDLENLCYTFSGSEYSDQELFDKTISSDELTITYSFGGQELLVLSKISSTENRYILTVNELNGTLSFNIVCSFSGITTKLESTAVYKKLNVNYINPSVYQNQNYQNVLGGNSINLSNFVSVTNSSGTESLTYSLVDFYASITIDGTNLSVSETLTSDIYAKVLVKLGSSTNYIFVRAVPLKKYSILNNARTFNVLKKESINLFDYVKIYNFSNFDSVNEPVYSLVVSNITFNKINSDGTTSDDTISLEPFNFSLTDDMSKVKVTVDGIDFTFVAKDFAIEPQQVGLGETLNLNSLAIASLNTISLSNSNYKITYYNENGYVDANGDFVGLTVGVHSVTININGADFIVEISVNNLEIDITNLCSVVETNSDTNEQIKYENFYASQSATTTEYVKILETDLSSGTQTDKTTNYLSNLVFDFKNFDEQVLSEYGLELSSSSSGAIQIKKKDTSTVLFEIDSSNISCNIALTTTLEFAVEISLKNNSVVKKLFYIRLLPVVFTQKTVTITNADVCYDSSSGTYYYNLLNVASAKTIAESNNINLNDKISFYTFYNSKFEEISNGKLEIGKDTTSYTVYASLVNSNEEIEKHLISITYRNNDSYLENITLIKGDSISSNSSNILTDWAISKGAVVNAIRGKITYTYDAGVYSVYDFDSNFLFKISSSGVVSEINQNINFREEIIVEAKLGSLIETGKVPIYNDNGISFNSVNFNRYSLDNGAKVLNLMSGETLDLSGFLNDATISADDEMVGVAIENSNTKIIKANNVETTTYGYFYVSKTSNSGTTKITSTTKVYVKIHPTSISKNYTDDFTFAGDSVREGTTTIISKGETFKQIYVLASSTGTKIDLSKYVKVEDFLGDSYTISYSIDKIIENVTGSSSNDSYSNNSSLATLEGTKLTFKESESTYYVKIKAELTYNQQLVDNVILNFKVTLVTDESVSGIEIENNSTINLQNLIKIYANSSDSVYSGASEKENIFKKVDIKLVGVVDSYISSSNLIVSEKNISKFDICYTYFDETKTICVTINNSSNSDSFTKNGISYEEKSNSSSGINLLTNASSTSDEISSLNVSYNGQTYTGVIETETTKVGSTTIVKTYFKVDGIMRVLASSTKDDDNVGQVEFWDETASVWSKINNIGVLYVTISRIKTITANSISLSYTTTSNFKLNDYVIRLDNTSNAIVYEKNFATADDGTITCEEIKNVLYFTIVNDSGEMISTSKITDSIVVCNGITLNTKTGEYSGTKTDSSVKMFIKAYVPSNKLSFGENFKLFEI